jgi:hypothetical protein
MKMCPSCGETLPATAFGCNRSRPDGLSFYCLACNRRRNNRWYRDSRRAQGRVVRGLSWVPAGFRWCPSCEQAVALAQYARNSRTASGYGSRCRGCANAASKAGYFYRTYGLTQGQLAALREAQADACGICGEPSPQHLDHDHSTGTIRQFLCQRCNHGLGLLKDDPAVLRAAAEYVEKHRREQRGDRPRPASGRRPQVTGRVQGPPVGSPRRPPVLRRTGLCSRGRALLAAREVDE